MSENKGKATPAANKAGAEEGIEAKRKAKRATAGARKAAARKIWIDYKDENTAPAACAGDIVMLAPARGPCVIFEPMVALPDGEKGTKFVSMGYRGRKALRRSDAFDRMESQATRRGPGSGLTFAEVDAGRDYGRLSEEVAAAGYVSSSAFRAEQTGRRSGRSDFMDRYSASVALLNWYRRAIGTGIAMKAKRPGADDKRLPIPVRELVDRVCIADQTISEVLRAHRWEPNADRVKEARTALRAALGRMVTR